MATEPGSREHLISVIESAHSGSPSIIAETILRSDWVDAFIDAKLEELSA